MSKRPISDSRIHPFYTANSLRRKNYWLVNLRWVSTILLLVFAIIITVIRLDNYPYLSLIVTACALAFANLIVYLYLKKREPINLTEEENIVLTQIAIDYVILTFLIHFTGGIDSPFSFFYLFHIIIASVIFERKQSAFIMAGIAVLLFSSLVVAENLRVINHFGHGVKAFDTIDIIFALTIFYITIFTSTYIGITLMMRHKKVKDLLYDQNVKLEKSEKEKMQFFRFVSHELKSPIIAIQSAINVVLDVMGGDLKQQAKNMLERGRKRTIQMIEILKDLVSLSYDEEIEKRKPEMIDPCDHISDIVDFYRPGAVEKSINIIENICQERVDFKIDKYIFEKILTNLISNAVRYTPEGGEVKIVTEVDENFWNLIVADSGIGIPKDEQKLIFNEFYRTQIAKNFESVGTGLGMSIIKRMVEQENGTITLKSEVGQGSTFTVRFPLS